MKMNLKVVLATGSVLSVMLGCTDQPTQVQPRAERTVAPVSVLETETREPEEFARELAGQFPGFGGYYFDDAGDLVVRLKDPARRDEVAAALQPFLRSYPWSAHRPRDREPQVIVQSAAYDFLELAAWRDWLFLRVFDRGDAAWLDLDEVANRIAIGVVSEEAKLAVARLALEAGIPAEALTIEVGARATGAQTLRDYQRPQRAGFQIEFENGGVCTMGPGAWLANGALVFLSNSHCTEIIWGLDSADVFQPDRYTSKVGFETLDPSPVSCGFLSPNQCRYADVTALASSPVGDTERGYIARTTYYSYGPGSYGSVTVDSISPRLKLSGTVSYPASGTVVDKVGRTSGWTYGVVDRTCVDHHVAYRSNSVLRCQWEANFGATYGDSGSPVFIYHSTDHNQFLGIFWGIVASDESRRVFSAKWNIEQDLGTVYYIANGVH